MNARDKWIRRGAERCLMAAALVVGLLAGCASRYPMQARTPVRHVVTVDLLNEADSGEFSRDCGSLLQIPGVVNVLTGPGLETGQPEAVPCDVGVAVDVANADACVQLSRHPAYRALMDKWRGRAAAIRAASFGPRCEAAGGDPTGSKP